ncbi:MAG: HAD family hydrolase [Candidatus Heimdallarchaeota archaeon]|nr:HAD family hydrolase [Candidatus Heimdallarchaeota archaeon]
MELESIIFDVDGTIVNNSNIIIRLFKVLVKRYTGKDMSTQDVVSLWGPPGNEIFKRVFPSEVLGQAWQEFLVEYRKSHPTAGYFTVDDFNIMKSKVKYLAIFTGKSRETLKISLETLGFNDIFDYIMTGNDVERSKPYPDALFQIIGVLNLNKTNTIFIGDSPLDIIAGKSAGIKTAAATWGSVELDNLLATNPDFVFKSPNDFKEFILNE